MLFLSAVLFVCCVRCYFVRRQLSRGDLIGLPRHPLERVAVEQRLQRQLIADRAVAAARAVDDA